MTDFFGFIGKEFSYIHLGLSGKLDNSHQNGSFNCYYGNGFDLSVYEDDSLFVVSLGYLSSSRSKSYSLENATCSSCATNIANLYSSNKDDFYNLIDGNFSFCIFDKAINKTIFARDKMGSRPLYVCFQEDCFLFSSNQKFFLNNTSIKISLDDEVMAGYLALKIQESDKTFFNEIRRLTPFTVLLLDNSSLETSYRKHSFRRTHLSLNNPVKAFKDQFEAAIKRCWRDRVKIGLMFSGGLDSSSIAAGLNKSGFSEIEAFSCNYSHLPQNTRILSDEAEFQLHVIKKLHLSHTQIELAKISPLKSLMEQFKYFSEPTHFPNLYLFEQVALGAQSKNIDIIFDGQDGDNIVSHGLERFRELTQVGNIFGFFYELICYAKYNGYKLKSVLRQILISILKNWGLLKHVAINSTVLNQKTFERYFGGNDPNITVVDSHLDKLNSPIHCNALETKYLVFKNHRIHVRSPFYDKDLIEFCLNIPSKWKLRDGKTRFILREYLLMMGLEKISSRKKKADLGHGLVDNIRRLDLDKIQYELENIHPYLQDFINQERMYKFFRDFKSSDGWEDPKLMGLLAVYTANHWLKNELNFESINFEEG